MNAATSWTAELSFLLPFAVGTAITVGLAALLGRCVRSAFWQRAIWQVCTLALAAQLAGELTGLTAGVAGWLTPRASAIKRSESNKPRAPTLEGLSSEAAVEVERVPAPNVALDAFAESAVTMPPHNNEAARVHGGTLGTWLALTWLIGSGVVAGRVAVGRLLLAALRRRQRPVEEPQLRERVLDLAARLGLRRPVRVMESAGLHGPVAFGILRPTIALPDQFSREFDPRKQDVMLAHELAHLAGHDPAWHLLAEVVVAVLWWHPLAWWSRARLWAASEAAADEASLLVQDGPGVLASCLVELGARLVPPQAAGWLRMAGSGFRSGLGRRVERLLRLGGGPWSPPSRFRLALVFLIGPPVLLGAAVAPAAWARPVFPDEGDSSMFHWKHSLSGVLFAAALGFAGDTAVAQPPDQPATGTSGAGASKPDDPQKELKRIQEDLNKLRDQIDAARKQATQLEEEKKLLEQRSVRGKDDPRVRAAVAQLAAAQKQLAQAEEEKAKLAAQEEALQAKRIKVFRLVHRSPEDVAVVVQSLLGSSRSRMAGRVGRAGAAANAVPTGGGFAGGGGFTGGGGGGFAGGAAGGFPGGGGGVPMGGGMGGFGGFTARGATGWRVVADTRTNSLIVQGSERDLQLAADVIAVFDLPANKPMPKVKNLTAIRLKNADATNLAAVLAELDLDVRIAPVAQDLLIVVGPEAAIKELGEVIKELDVEGKDPRKQSN